jgi:hypothetical protein
MKQKGLKRQDKNRPASKQNNGQKCDEIKTDDSGASYCIRCEDITILKDWSPSLS